MFLLSVLHGKKTLMLVVGEIILCWLKVLVVCFVFVFLLLSISPVGCSINEKHKDFSGPLKWLQTSDMKNELSISLCSVYLSLLGSLSVISVCYLVPLLSAWVASDKLAWNQEKNVDRERISSRSALLTELFSPLPTFFWPLSWAL